MGVPDYETLMLPVLQAVGDGEPRTLAEVRNVVAAELHLTTGVGLTRAERVTGVR